MQFYNKDRNKQNLQSLLNASKTTNLSSLPKITPFQAIRFEQKQKTPDFSTSINSFLGGASNLYKGIKNFNTNNGETNNSGSAISDAINNNVFGNSEELGPLSSAINSEVLGSSATSGFNGMPLIGNAISGIKGLANTGTWQGGVQGIFGVNENDSDIMQGINGTLNGGLTGFAMGGPVGAAIGTILGLGSSFLDDF